MFTNIKAQTKVTVSGKIIDFTTKSPVPFASVLVKLETDSTFVSGTATNEAGFFSLENIKSANYILEVSYLGYQTKKQPVFVGKLSKFLKLPTIELQENATSLDEITITSKANLISGNLDKKTFALSNNQISSGGSVLQAMQNLPSVTINDGKIQLRGSDKVTVLINGKQTALTGFGNQSGLDNIPASAIDKIEIINNPSAKYEANGNAGIINIIYKKNNNEGFNGKVGFTTGLGSLWERKDNFPTIRPQYSVTPKVNPSVSLNYLKNKVNIFFQGDYLYTETLTKNEFVERTYDNGDFINQQLKRNRDTHFTTLKSGVDWNFNDQNSLTISGLFGSEKIIDRGDQPFFNQDFSERLRLWQFLEDELKTTVIATADYQHKFQDPGHSLNIGFNYTFHREDEQYFYDNFLPSSKGKDAFKLLSDEQVYDFNVDYKKPLKYGFFETGLKFRFRNIPTNMLFIPGVNSVLDADAGGEATYNELIPAIYGNYTYETETWEAELGVRLEHVQIDYDVNPNHPTYKSDGYNYTQPFPNVRIAYKFNTENKISVFYNRRVDRPNEVDIRIFPKYDDAEIIKVGNPELQAQFTNSIELGHKYTWETGSIYSALYHKFSDGTITRISSIVPNSNLIYAIFQNVNKSFNSGVEVVFEQEITDFYDFNTTVNVYRNQIDAFTVENQYPTPHIFSADTQQTYSGNLKLNNSFHFKNDIEAQVSAVYLAPDIIPQGKVDARFSLDFGVKKTIQKGKGALFINATDILNTMVLKREIEGNEFSYTANDYYETQVVRIGYSYKF
ncbi:TonB-dependent receptor [uncultured Polaribacter sp.]|uniref:TonB-dependent receptor domain-containing protein n=1 Tax=uncultured Polaribacter sp. TaxID=174711 RepID=UPI002616FBA1|nr:TonB-dependent receptor [uncultured Polaribacter sp.]